MVLALLLLFLNAAPTTSLTASTSMPTPRPRASTARKLQSPLILAEKS